MCWSGTYSSPVSRSRSTRCRWLKVPRAQSWPLRRTGVPSYTSVPKASASAIRPVDLRLAREQRPAAREERDQLGVQPETLGQGGQTACDFDQHLHPDVCAARGLKLAQLLFGHRERDVRFEALVAAPALLVRRVEALAASRRGALSTSSRVTTFSRTSFSAYSVTTDGRSLIFL